MEWSKIILRQSRNVILWIPKFNFRDHTKPQLDHNLKKINPVQTLTYYTFKIHLILNSSTSRSSMWPLPHTIFNYKFICISQFPHPCYLSTSPSLISHTSNILYGVQAVKFFIMQISPSLPPPPLWDIKLSPRLPVFKQI
jgi:hypothetical protein